MERLFGIGSLFGACLIALAFAGPLGCDGGGGEGEDGEDEDEGPTMAPGEACLDCHAAGSGSEAAEEAAFTAAGTVFADGEGTAGVDGATITLVDADGNTVTVTSNSAGNFYTSEPLAFPVDVTITNGADTVGMLSAGNGDCNSCHGGAPIHIP